MIHQPAKTDIRLLKLRPAGMFSNVNEVVQQLYLAELGGYCFLIDWGRSCYRETNRPGDPWNYYFEPCFLDISVQKECLPVLPGGVGVVCTRDNIITPRLKDGVCDPLLLPLDRRKAATLIKKYIRPLPNIISRVDEFKRRHFNRCMIGLHIRGAGKTDGGVSSLRAFHELTNGVPLKLYFDTVDSILQDMPCAHIFVCSDSSMVVNATRERFSGRVIAYPSTRSEFGEMHKDHPQNAGQSFPRAKLGADVLIEALLLSETDMFVHGISNVVNFVLCASPELKQTYIYGKNSSRASIHI